MSRARDTADQINRINSSAADATAITVTSSENVGIGTSSPATDGKLTIHGTDTDSGILLSRSSGNDVAIHNIGGTLAFRTGGESTTLGGLTERMRIDSSGNVLIGTTSDNGFKFKVSDSGGFEFAFAPNDGGSGVNNFVNYNRSGNAYVPFMLSGLDLRFGSNGNTERMRIDSSGSVLVGSTLNDPIARATSAIEIAQAGYININRDSNISSYFGRSGSDGTIITFYKGTSNVGSIGRGGSGFFISGVASSDFGVVFDGSGLISSNSNGVLRDNQYNIGHGSYRWTNIYATNGSINTSDQTEKQDIASLTATEMLVAKRISAMFKNYRWKDKVATEGDGARNHTGIIAQDVQAAFTAESLDASKYGLFCSDTWWETQTDVPAVEAVAEVTDEDGNVTTEAVEAVDAYTRTNTYDTEAEAPEGATEKTRLGIRYSELLSFVAAYNEQRFASIEARLTALEA